jgi:hypothetical protein
MFCSFDSFGRVAKRKVPLQTGFILKIKVKKQISSRVKYMYVQQKFVNQSIVMELFSEGYELCI